MLTKLLKYEIKATGRILLPLYITLVAFALLNKLFISNSVRAIISKLTFSGDIIILIFTSVYIFMLVTVSVATLIIILQRFYKNLLGDEGYLMNTLPVNSYEHVLCKFINAIIWIFIGFIVSVISVLILCYYPDLFNNILNLINTLINKDSSVIVFIIKFLILCILQTCTKIMLFYMSISVGQLNRNYKKLSAVAVYIVVESAVSAIIGLISAGSSFDSIDNVYFINSFFDVMPFFNKIFIIGLLSYIILFSVYFFLTNFIIKNKLNLE